MNAAKLNIPRIPAIEKMIKKLCNNLVYNNIFIIFVVSKGKEV